MEGQEEAMTRNSSSFVLLAAALSISLAGCNRSGSGDDMGPAQKAGKAVDEAGAKVSSVVQQQVAKADEATQHAREKAKDATEQARDNLDRATAKVGEKVEKAGEKLQEAAR
jgi:predicted small secreted protein